MSVQKNTVSEFSGNTHAITLENRSKMILSGINEVISFDEKQVLLNTSQGKLTIDGKNLHMTALALDDGRLMMEGQITAIVYSGKEIKQRKNLWELLR